jgi:hypothetical protein
VGLEILGRRCADRGRMRQDAQPRRNLHGRWGLGLYSMLGPPSAMRTHSRSAAYLGGSRADTRFKGASALRPDQPSAGYVYQPDALPGRDRGLDTERALAPVRSRTVENELKRRPRPRAAGFSSPIIFVGMRSSSGRIGCESSRRGFSSSARASGSGGPTSTLRPSWTSRATRWYKANAIGEA